MNTCETTPVIAYGSASSPRMNDVSGWLPARPEAAKRRRAITS